MKVTAIVAEYNPIHPGHAVHMERAKKETGADRIIIVMSGDYVQRGCPAIISKYERARSALLSGADLVLELPLCYSTGSSEYFSRGAVSLIKQTGVVNCISFGSECGDISLLEEAADLTGSLDDDCSKRLRDLLAEGISYSNAINSVLDLPSSVNDLLKTPNNLLAVAYIKAAHDLSFDCGFHTAKRIGASYHDDSPGAMSSTALRREMLARGEGMSEDDFSMLLFHRLQTIIRDPAPLQDPIDALTSYLDVSPSLAGRIINKYAHASSFSNLCDELKSKDINRSRISRALLHILLGIRKEDVDRYVSGGYNYYIKPLGFKKEAAGLLHAIKNEATLPLISKNADAASILKDRGPDALKMFNNGIAASDLYNKAACTLCKRPFISEYERSPVIL